MAHRQGIEEFVGDKKQRPVVQAIAELRLPGNGHAERGKCFALDLRKHRACLHQHDIKAIQEALERDNFMDAEGAREFGLVDQVIEKRPDDGAAKA